MIPVVVGILVLLKLLKITFPTYLVVASERRAERAFSGRGVSAWFESPGLGGVCGTRGYGHGAGESAILCCDLFTASV